MLKKVIPIVFLVFSWATIQVSANRTWFVIHGMGTGIKNYKSGGKFYEVFQKNKGPKDHVLTHAWHEPQFIQDVGNELISKIQDMGLQSYERTMVMFALRAIMDNPVQGFFAGAPTINRIMGSYKLAMNILDEAAKNNTVTLVGNSYGGHVSCGATQLLAGERSVKDIMTEESTGAIFTPLLEMTNEFSSPSEIAEQLANQSRKSKKQFLSLLACCAEKKGYNDALEDTFEATAIIWELCKKIVDLKKGRLFNKTRTRPFIDTLYMIGTPAVRGCFQPNMSAVNRIFNLYSDGDIVCQKIGGHKLDDDPQSNSLELEPEEKQAEISQTDVLLQAKKDIAIDLEIVLPGTGWCCNGEPTHMELVGHEKVGMLITELDKELPKDLSFEKDGKFIWEKKKGWIYETV